MSALVPPPAVCTLYRRYLKSANNITNITIRMMLLQQVRNSFRRHSNVRSAAAQRELIVQAHKDLNILEDKRLQRSLYINRLGMVSCIDWESRRTEFHLDPKIAPYIIAVLSCILFLFHLIPFFTYTVEDKFPKEAKAVSLMHSRVHGGTVEEAEKAERNRIEGMLSTSQRQRELQRRILSTFDDAPHVDAPRTNHKVTSIHSL